MGIRNLQSAIRNLKSGHGIAEIDILTTSGYLIVMTDVRIADLKSRLSEHLRTVRSGRSLTVFDRDTPIARIVPYEEKGAALDVRAPRPGSPRLQEVPLPPSLALKVDVVDLLMEERQAER